MAIIKTSELTRHALNYAVALCEDMQPVFYNDGITKCIFDGRTGLYSNKYSPSTDWAQGGPIIARERISPMYEPSLIYDDNARWKAMCSMSDVELQYGSTPLIAAMRCYVMSKLGKSIEIPDELI